MSMNSEFVQNIRLKALRCRELAKAASDPEVAEELLRIAAELETALHLIGNSRFEDASKAIAGLRKRSVSDSSVEAS
jgi:hypothetical protein